MGDREFLKTSVYFVKEIEHCLLLLCMRTMNACWHKLNSAINMSTLCWMYTAFVQMHCVESMYSLCAMKWWCGLRPYMCTWGEVSNWQLTKGKLSSRGLFAIILNLGEKGSRSFTCQCKLIFLSVICRAVSTYSWLNIFDGYR